MPIYVISTIKQKNAAIFPLLEDSDLLGGFRVCATTSVGVDARDNIPSTYRKLGMFVWTQDTLKLWRLGALPNTWVEISTGGGGSSTALSDTINAGGSFNAGDPVALNASGLLVLAGAEAGSPHEVYGIALTVGVPAAPADVVTSGIVVNAAWSLSVGDIYYLGLLGGITNTPPDISAAPNRGLVRVGTARTSTTLLVRPQVIAFS